MVEQLTCNQQVPSSTLGGGTIHNKGQCFVLIFILVGSVLDSDGDPFFLIDIQLLKRALLALDLDYFPKKGNLTSYAFKSL